VEYQQILNSCRFQGLLPINLESPLPPLRRRLDQEGSFRDIGPQEIVPNSIPREYILALEETSVFDLKDEGFRPANPPITDLSVPILVQIVPPKVTTHDCHFVRRLDMGANNTTSIGSPHTPILIVG
jgi:hypothetical protein